jgi:hypothetical protein
MHPTTNTLLLGLLAALLAGAPAVAEATGDEATGALTTAEGPCTFFWYTINPLAYKVDWGCLPIPLPVLDNSP